MLLVLKLNPTNHRFFLLLVYKEGDVLNVFNGETDFGVI